MDEILDNSRIFKVHRWSDYPEVRGLTAHLLGKLFSSFPNPKVKYVRGKALRVLLLDLFCSYVEDSSQFIAISLSKNRYVVGERYNKLFLRYEPIKKCLNKLVEYELVEMVVGDKSPNPANRRLTRIRATEALQGLFRDAEWKVECAFDALADEIIIVRDPDTKEFIDYEDNRFTVQIRHDLERYNQFISNYHIGFSFNGVGFFNPPQFRSDVVQFRRIFLDESFESGGRFYCGHYQNVDKRWRQFITLNGEPTIEIDYGALHPTLAYAKVGHDFLSESGGIDIYMPDRFDYDDETYGQYRSLVKEATLALLNADSEVSATRAVMSKLKEHYKDRKHGDPDLIKTFYPLGATYKKVQELIEWIKAQHPIIHQLFAQDLGRHFQFIDSQIANRVLTRMMNEGRPALPVHDSFICCETDAQALRSAMQDCFNEQLREVGFTPIQIRIK